MRPRAIPQRSAFTLNHTRPTQCLRKTSKLIGPVGVDLYGVAQMRRLLSRRVGMQSRIRPPLVIHPCHNAYRRKLEFLCWSVKIEEVHDFLQFSS